MSVSINVSAASGMGLPNGSNSSQQAVAVTGANDFAFQRQNQEPFLGAGTQGITLTAAGAGTVNGADQFNKVGSGANIYINVASVTGSLTVTVQGKDPASGQYYTILASAAIAATGLTVLKIGRGLTAAANSVANDQMPLTYRINTTVATGPVTATIADTLIV
jgi:hypothetical protein